MTTRPRRKPKTPMDVAGEITAGGVQTVSGAGRSVTNLSIRDLIALDKHQMLKDATRNPGNLAVIRTTPNDFDF